MSTNRLAPARFAAEEHARVKAVPVNYDAYEIVRASAYDISVKVSYREGWSMQVQLITDGTDWQVYAYDRWQQ